MPHAKDVAIELRRLADALDQHPNAVVRKPLVFMTHYGDDEKEMFLALAKLLPRPFNKVYKDNEVRLEYENLGISFIAKINQSSVCRLVKPAIPAVFECDPILSQEEEESLV